MSGNPASSLRVLIVGVVVAAMVYGAALTLALTRNLGSTAAIIVLIVGAVLLPVSLFIVRRRMWQPLSEIERGIRRVSDGDLSTQVPVSRSDELGTVAGHFNQMTRVLRDRAEEQGRFAAAGELLSGVAHEVNNPLMAIASHAELRLADAHLTAEQRNEMQSILRQAQRAAKLLRGLLRFVRAGEKRAARVNMNDVVRSAIDLVSYRFGVDEISIEGRLDPELPIVVGDANRLEQVVVNLLSNALDALRQVKPPRRLIVDSFTDDTGGRVCVTVTDNGPGVAAEIAPRLFRPFASTKGHKGTGLGLYISRQLVREAQGELELVKLEQPGARFMIWLPTRHEAVPTAPAATPQPAQAAPAAVPAAAPSGTLGGVRILLVDDEELIRRPMARFLGKRGAEIKEAGDGLAALDRLREGFQPHVILADLRMPKMDGAEFYQQLQRQQPALADRVLFLSGDITHLAGRGLAEVPRDRVLVKPVELAELERRIVTFVQEKAA
ncbi:MAG TPA: ATP-binding protein [Gemmatimonadales bacterium]|nr:ATP-binding protein [Gemmatimonadales bacterium]